LGVFELADSQGTVLYIGFAGGLSQYGLKGEVAQALQQVAQASLVRYEVTTAYHTRYRELLMAHQADFDALPLANPEMNSKLGKISPA
jgi:UDP:flavonoid glycosyltransferase YjiC (YdhE family)